MLTQDFEIQRSGVEAFAKRCLDDPDYYEAVRRGDESKIDELKISKIPSRTKDELDELAKDPGHNDKISPKTIREKHVEQLTSPCSFFYVVHIT